MDIRCFPARAKLSAALNFNLLPESQQENRRKVIKRLKISEDPLRVVTLIKEENFMRLRSANDTPMMF